VESNDDAHYLTRAHAPGTLALTLTANQQLLVPLRHKYGTKIINITEEFQ
jgi:hypothetical protein